MCVVQAAVAAAAAAAAVAQPTCFHDPRMACWACLAPACSTTPGQGTMIGSCTPCPAGLLPVRPQLQTNFNHLSFFAN